MKIEVNKNVLAGAIVALGKLVCRTSTMVEYKSVQMVVSEILRTF